MILPLSGIETSNGLASGCRLRYVTERLGQHVPLGDDRLHQIGVDCHPETPATAAWAPSRRSAVEMCSALQLDASQLPNLVPPCDTNMRRQPQLCPEPDELIDVDEPADIVVIAFGEDDLVYLEALSRVVQVP